MEKTYPELAREAMSRRTFITAASASAAFAAAASMAGVALADDADKNADASKPHAEGSLAAANQAAGTANAYYPTNDPNLFPPCAAGEGEIAFVAEPIADADIVATHDVDVAWAFAARATVLVDGGAVTGDAADVLLDPVLAQRARLSLPWAPMVARALGRDPATIHGPDDLLDP